MNVEKVTTLEVPGSYLIVGHRNQIPQFENCAEYTIPGACPLDGPRTLIDHLSSRYPIIRYPTQKDLIESEIPHSRSSDPQIIQRGENEIILGSEKYSIYYHVRKRPSSKVVKVAINDENSHDQVFDRDGSIMVRIRSLDPLAWTARVDLSGKKQGTLVRAGIEWVNNLVSTNKLWLESVV